MENPTINIFPEKSNRNLPELFYSKEDRSPCHSQECGHFCQVAACTAPFTVARRVGRSQGSSLVWGNGEQSAVAVSAPGARLSAKPKCRSAAISPPPSLGRRAGRRRSIIKGTPTINIFPEKSNRNLPELFYSKEDRSPCHSQECGHFCQVAACTAPFTVARRVGRSQGSSLVWGNGEQSAVAVSAPGARLSAKPKCRSAAISPPPSLGRRAGRRRSIIKGTPTINIFPVWGGTSFWVTRRNKVAAEKLLINRFGIGWTFFPSQIRPQQR